MSPRNPKRHQAGLTMVETAVVISVSGVFLAAFVPTFVHHLQTSKIAEASQELATLHAKTAAYFDSVHRTQSGRLERACLPAAAGPAPARPSMQPRTVDFANPSTRGAATFSALGFQPEFPIRYRYSFIPKRSGCGLDRHRDATQPALLLRAEGDLDGDGVLSTFERAAAIDEHGKVAPLGILHIEHRVE